MKKVYAVIVLLIVLSCTTTKHPWQLQVPTYKPESQALYDTIVHMDSLWEDAYNNCRLEVQGLLMSDSLEYYHDRNGVLTSKAELITVLKNEICGKVTRELLDGSIEVYPIKDYGAVQMGYHRFHNKVDTTMSNYSPFVHIWRNEKGQWRITRVVSLHSR
ncbi:nuclear transport factor 2 family protein [Longitalea luteola]|uniref:nuclear transport factor 2 family protein n=1 Tax=Longitalea luteola TaxID=2812563 RepID=UPI001A95A838|nr:nuclear transport factor 2 family protein [Longitalea luteola]